MSFFRWFLIGCGLAGIAAMVFLAWRPSPHLNNLPWMPFRFALWADGNPDFRTAIPFFAFGLWALAVRGCWPGNRIAASLFPGGFVLALALESVQAFLPTRTFAVGDLVWAAAGLFVAWLLWWGVSSIPADAGRET